MSFLSPAMPRQHAPPLVMPEPSPLGRLIRRRRIEMGLTQEELADLVGEGMTQNQVSRLESGKTQSINEQRRIAAMGKALGLDSDVDFILAAYAPGMLNQPRRKVDPVVEVLPPGPEGEIIALVRRRTDDQKRKALELLRVLFADEPPVESVSREAF